LPVAVPCGSSGRGNLRGGDEGAEERQDICCGFGCGFCCLGMGCGFCCLGMGCGFCCLGMGCAFCWHILEERGKFTVRSLESTAAGDCALREPRSGKSARTQYERQDISCGFGCAVSRLGIGCALVLPELALRLSSGSEPTSRLGFYLYTNAPHRFHNRDASLS